MYLVLSLLLIFSNSLYANTKTNTLDAYLSDASISVSNGDFYRAYKLYSYSFKNSEGGFQSSAVEDYLYATSKIASKKRFVNTCKIFSKKNEIKNRVKYQCAKLLYQKGDHKAALTFAKEVDDKEKISALTNLLVASIHLASNSFDRCIKTIGSADSSLYKKYHLHDIYYLTKARCYNEKNDYNAAIRNYQSITSDSRYYFTSLYEMTWSFLKVRDLRGLSSTTEAIFSMYNPNVEKSNGTGASAKHYFQSKYMLAFLDLVLFTGKEDSDFPELEKSLISYKKNHFISKNDVKDFYKEVVKSKSLQGLKRDSKVYKRFFYHIGQWLSFHEVNEIRDISINLIALSKEIDRSKSYKIGSKSYIANLKKLKNYYDRQLKKRLAYSYDKAKRSMNGFILKNKIANLDFKNLQKTQGLRSLEEATVEYRNKENNINIKLGAIRD